MNLSMKIALDESENKKFILGDLGFILVVLRDNTLDDFVREVLDNIILGEEND